MEAAQKKNGGGSTEGVWGVEITRKCHGKLGAHPQTQLIHRFLCVHSEKFSIDVRRGHLQITSFEVPCNVESEAS